MASDRELLALQVSGIGPLAMLRPVLLLGIAVALATAVIAQEVEYRARRQFREVATRIATRGTTLEPGGFLPLGSRILHARESPRRGELEGIMIADWSDLKRPMTIFAEHGRFGFDTQRHQFRFRLERGEIHVEPKNWLGEYQRVSFESLDYGGRESRQCGKAAGAGEVREPRSLDAQAMGDERRLAEQRGEIRALPGIASVERR